MSMPVFLTNGDQPIWQSCLGEGGVRTLPSSVTGDEQSWLLGPSSPHRTVVYLSNQTFWAVKWFAIPILDVTFASQVWCVFEFSFHRDWWKSMECKMIHKTHAFLDMRHSSYVIWLDRSWAFDLNKPCCPDIFPTSLHCPHVIHSLTISSCNLVEYK